MKLDIFSGRPNPEWELDSAQERQLGDRLAHLPASSAKVEIPDLGYRGIVVTSHSGGVHRFFDSQVLEGLESRFARYLDQGREVERWLFETGIRSLDSGVYDQVRKII